MMDSSGFSLQRSNCFPAGLRVLAVDGDPACLKILEKMLKKWDYDVTSCNSTQEALDLLRERKDGFDIAICDVNMPDVDGFKLPEHVGLETDIPVIMMSADGETSRVMKWVQQGACDYLLKPVRMKELQNIWQHVVRKRMHMQEARGAEGHQGADGIQIKRNGTKQSDGGNSARGEMTCTRKRKNVENKHHDRECGDSSSTKKPRVVWNGDLHRKFVKAVNQIGPDKVGPKKILDLMGIPWLSRENVASHLQKYRLYLNRLKKEKEQIAAEPKSAPSGDVIDSPMSSTSRISFNPSFGSMDSEVKSEWKIPTDCSWNAKVPSIQFRQELKPHVQSEQQFDHLPLPITCFQVDPVFHCPIPSVREVDQVGNADANMFSVQLQEPIPCSLWSANNHNLEHYNIGPNLENLTLGTESSPCLWDGQFTGYPQSYFDPQNHVKFGCTNQELVADFPPYPNAVGDPVDYPLTGQGLVLQDFTSY